MKKDKRTYFLVFALFAVYVALIITAFCNIDNFAAVNLESRGTETVILDAGHGGEDGGAVANGIVEKDINLEITKKLADVFRASGFNVIMTRDSDKTLESEGTTIREKKVSDMKNRLSLFNKDINACVISIHQNKFTQEKYNGAQVFYSANNPESQRLAEALRSDITTLTQPDNTRECKGASKDIYLLYNCKAPSVIVECGFISNYEEAQKLKDEEYQKKLAFAIFSGYLKYSNAR